MNMSIFRRSRVVVVSQSNRTQIVISITSVVCCSRFQFQVFESLIYDSYNRAAAGSQVRD